jgi:hypothetical protein
VEIELRRITMLNKSKLIIAAALLAIGSSIMGAAALMGSTPASAQSFGNGAYAMEHASDKTGAYSGNVDERTYEIQKVGRVGP